MALEPAAEAEERRLYEEDELLFDDIAREVARLGLRDFPEVEAEEGRQEEEDAASAGPANGFLPRPVLLQRPTGQQLYLYGPPPPPLLPPRMLPPPFSPPALGMPGNHKLLDGWCFVVDNPGHGHAPSPQSFCGGGSGPPRAAWPRALPSDAAWPGRAGAAAANTQLVEACVQYLCRNEEQVLDTLFQGRPEAADAYAQLIVTNAVPLIESSHGTRLLGLVIDGCNDGLQYLIIARITRDHKRFFRICAARSDEVVGMIRSCRSERSLRLVRNAITPWMAPSIMHRLVTSDSNRLKVVQAFVQCVPDPYFAEFIFDAIAKNCLALVIHPHGLSLLQSCLEHVEWTAKDSILSTVARCSCDLAQHRFGNYIVQDVLKQRDPSHLAIIASRFRHHYVKLSRQRYSSNVVETCLEVFDDRERFAIVEELVWFPSFRDLVTDEFANYVISKALRTCKLSISVRPRLAQTQSVPIVSFLYRLRRFCSVALDRPMEPTEPQRGTKRPLPATAGGGGGDDDDRSDLADRKVRFPKGKKAKYRDPSAAGGSGEAGAAQEDIDSLMNPELAAVKRARRRHRREGDDAQGTANVKGFEMRYKITPTLMFNRMTPTLSMMVLRLNLLTWIKREKKDTLMIMDAWLDNVEVDTKYAEKFQKKKDKEEEFQDLSSDDIGKIKKRIADMLEADETIIQALKRLKSSSTDERGRMTDETQRMFDELTEAAMKLMENGEYNVYSDDRETFVREAEGYERLNRARLGIPEVEEDIFADTTEDDPSTSSLLEMDHGLSAANTSTTNAITDDDDSNLDMFGDNDDTDATCDSDVKTLDSGCNPDPVPQDASGTSGAEKAGNGSADSDYVYDPTSGYYYSSSTGYYYDSTSGCYCSASTGTWYLYDEQSGTYNEMQGEETGMHTEIQRDGVTE
ncbi:hypothetical protein ACQ4PT_031282 [Festuca glaucescens]